MISHIGGLCCDPDNANCINVDLNPFLPATYVDL